MVVSRLHQAMDQNLVSKVTSVESGGCEHEFGNQDASFDEDCYRAPNESDDLRLTICRVRSFHDLSCICHQPRVTPVLVSRTNRQTWSEFRPENISWRIWRPGQNISWANPGIRGKLPREN